MIPKLVKHWQIVHERMEPGLCKDKRRGEVFIRRTNYVYSCSLCFVPSANVMYAAVHSLLCISGFMFIVLGFVASFT